MKWLWLVLSLACVSGFSAEQPIDPDFLRELEAKAKTLTNTFTAASPVVSSALSSEKFSSTAKTRSAPIPAAERLLPADTLGFFTVPDWAKGQTGFSNSAMGQLWAEPAMKPFKEKFFEKLKAEKIQPLEKELGFQFTNFLNLARGQFTLAVVPNGWDGRSDKQPGMLWLIDTKENGSQLKTNLAELHRKWTDAGRKMRTEKIRGVEFTVVIVDAQEIGKSLQKVVPGSKPAAPDEPKPNRTVEWVIGQSDSLLIVSDAAKDVEKVLALQSGVSVPALAGEAAFASSAQMLRDAQWFGWIHVKPIMNTLARKPAEQPQGESLLGAMPATDRILNALGLSGVQTISFNMQQSVEGSTANIAMRVPESGRKGLFRILAVNAKDASPPPFVPADAVKFSRWRIDLQQAWTTIENMLVEISPQYAGFSKLILDTAGKDKDPNFDFRKQLLANLGDDVITYEKVPRDTATATPSTPSLTLIGSKNADQMALSLRAVTSIFPPDMISYSERDFLGRKVYSLTLPPGLFGAEKKSRLLTYAASGGYVAFSSDAAMLEEYLRSGEGMAKSLREFVGLNDAAQKVGGMATGYFSFENESESGRAAFEVAKKDPSAVTSLLGAGPLTTVMGLFGNDGKSVNESFDVALLPPYDRVAKYFHFDVSAIGVTPETITFKMFSPMPPALRK
jgi:hypothetical protein